MAKQNNPNKGIKAVNGLIDLVIENRAGSGVNNWFTRNLSE